MPRPSAHNAATGCLRLGESPDASPKSMSLYLFPQDGGKALRYEFAGHKGGKIRVPAGHYDALCLNSDTEGIYYRNTEKRTTFEVTTRTTALLSRLSSLGVPSQNAPRAEGTKNERVALEPDRVWSDHTENIQLKKLPTVNRLRFIRKYRYIHVPSKSEMLKT